MTAVTIAQLRAVPTVDLMTAARALGLGRTKACDLARRQQFPCRVIRIGDTYRVPTPGLRWRGSACLAHMRLICAKGPTAFRIDP
jgi:hypothetical protein